MHCTAVLRAGSWLKPRALPRSHGAGQGTAILFFLILVLDDVRGSQLLLTALGTSGEIKGCLGKDSQSLQPCQFPLLRNLGESAHEMSALFLPPTYTVLRGYYESSTGNTEMKKIEFHAKPSRRGTWSKYRMKAEIETGVMWLPAKEPQHYQQLPGSQERGMGPILLAFQREQLWPTS